MPVREKIKVEQWDLAGNKIAEFGSLGEATRVTGITKGSISNCINGKQRMAGGFLWKRVLIENEQGK